VLESVRSLSARVFFVLTIVCLVRPGLGSPGDVFEAPVPVLGADPPKERDLADGDASVSTQTGAFTYSYPVVVPPGRLVEPSLALTYTSGGALYGSSVGSGWQLAIPEIRRDPTQSRLALQDDPPAASRWVSSMAGGNRLVEVTEPVQSGTPFRAQYDSSYTRYERVSVAQWRARTTDGLTYNFGEFSNMEGGNDSTWAPLTSIVDPFGNTASYFYDDVRNNAGILMEHVLDRIEYTTNPIAGLTEPHARVVFTYTDPGSCILTGFGDLPIGARFEHRDGQARWVGSRRLDAIRTEVKGPSGWRPVRTITLSYDAQAALCGRERGAARVLTWIQESATSPTGVVTTMPAVKFSYGPAAPLRRVARDFFTGDGTYRDSLHGGVRRGSFSAWPELESMLLDFDGDGRLDQLTAAPDAQGCAFTWQRNTGTGFGPASARVRLPTFQWGNGSGADVGGDCSLSGQRSFFTNNPGGDPQCLGPNLGHYLSYRFLDLDSDGLPDLVAGLQVDSRYFDTDPNPLPTGWDLSYTCEGLSALRLLEKQGSCPELPQGALDGAEICRPDASCELDLDAASGVVRRAPRVPCGDLMRGAARSSGANQTTSLFDPEPPPPACATREHLQQCGEYLWVVFWNQGNGVLSTEPNPRLNPVPLESNQYDSGLGGKKGFSSSIHAVMDVDGDGVLDSVTVSGQPTLWYVFRGTGTGHFDGHGLVFADPYLFGRPEGSALGSSVTSWQLLVEGQDPAPDEGIATVGNRAGLMDLSGDGLPDLLYRPTGTSSVRAFLNMGDHFQFTTDNEQHPNWFQDKFSFSVAEDARSYSDSDENRWISSGQRFAWTTPVDFDGDGRMDLYVRSDPDFEYDGDSTSSTSDDEAVIFAGNGAGSLGAAIEVPTEDRDGVGQRVVADEDFRVVRDLVDINGDGVADFVRWDAATDRFVYFTDQQLLDGKPPRLMNRIDNGAGGVTEVRYRSSSDRAIDIPGTDDTQGMPTHTWVVDTITRTDSSDTDGNTGTAAGTSSYLYGRPIFNRDLSGEVGTGTAPLDLRARYGFRGFERVQAISPLGAVTENVYDYDGENLDWSGRLVETTVYKSTADRDLGRPHSIQQTTWGVYELFDGKIRTFNPNDVKTWRCSAGQDRAACLASGALRVETTTWLHKTADGDDPDMGIRLLYFRRAVWKKRSDAIQDRDRRNFYAARLFSGPDFYRFRVTSEHVYERVDGVDQQRAQRVHFWGLDPAGHDGAFETATRDHLESGATATTQYRQDDLGLGLLARRRKPEQYQANLELWQTTSYDTTYPVHPLSTQNELGHLEETDYDLGTGTLVAERGPNSVVACGGTCVEKEGTRTVIDGFGRPLEVYAMTEDPADNTLREILVQRFTYFDRDPAIDGAPRMVREERRIDWNGSLFTQLETEYDGFGRQMKRRVTRSETPQVVERFRYDAQGNIEQVQLRDPSVDSQANVFYRYLHDGLDRPEEVERPDGTKVQWTYDGLATTRVEVAASGPEAETTTTADPFGRLVKVEERNGTALATTIYLWDANDNLKQVNNPEGIETRLEHDWMSRRTKITRGSREWSYTYDLNGNMLTETPPVPAGGDPLDYITSTAYDAIDRPDSRIAGVRASEDWIDEFASTIDFDYDEGLNGLGRLTSVSTTAWDRTFIHDARGNVVSDQLHFDLQAPLGVAIADTRTIERRFNPLGSVVEEWHGDEDGQTGPTHTTTTYDRRGLPKTLDWQLMTPVTLATATWNGAGLMTSLGQGGYSQSWTHDQVGRVLHMQASSSSASPAVQIYETWTYYGADDPHTLETSRSTLGARTFTFSYDDRHQIDSAWDDPASYTSSFTYHDDGRLETAHVASTNAPLAPPRDVEYIYPDATEIALDPEAVEELRNLSGGSAFTQYAFDSAGNVTSRNATGNDNFQFLYDGDDQQRVAVAQNGDEVYYYDHTGQRFLAVSRGNGGSVTGIRLWHGALEVTYNGQGQATRTVVDLALGKPVARIENRTTRKRVVHGQLGHFLGAFNELETGLDVAFVYGPFGEILAQSGSAADYTERFNGKEQDALTSLSYYGVRYFDPLSLTWTQADPLYRFAPDAAWDQPRRANLYAFSLQNPLRYVDQDGRDGALCQPGGCMGQHPPGPVTWGQAAKIAAVTAAVMTGQEWAAVLIVGGTSEGKTEGQVLGDVVVAAALGGAVGGGGGALSSGAKKLGAAVKGIGSGLKGLGGLIKKVAGKSSSARRGGGPMTKLYHGGKLQAGKVLGRRLSTTTDKGHAGVYANKHGGEVHEFNVPTKELKEMEAQGAAQEVIDQEVTSGSTATEWRFRGDAAEKLNNYKKPTPQ
jgi:RHS repeat-associated protein